jgi:TolB-like protein/Tfp pilus assembly protein PilF
MGADEVGTMRDLTQRRAILDGLIATHRGRIANTAGDSVLAEFGSAVDAVQCAVEAQAALATANAGLSPDRHMNFRIGIHVGDVMVKGGDLFGDSVNIAARLQTIATAGGVCVSGVAHDQVRKIIRVAFKDLGAQPVKNIEESVKAFAVIGNSGSTAKEPLALPDQPSIVVLPFQNMSGDPEQEYFADGMVEDIIAGLSRKRNMFVIARNSSFIYKGKAVDIKQVGRELGVRYVLEGSVRKAGSRIRITGQLIDVSSGAHLWADKFDGDLEDVFDLQDRVTASVIGAISPHLDRAEMDRAKRKPTSSLKAYDFYLRGLAEQMRYAQEASDRALPLIRKAIELDPDFALAHAAAANWFASRRIWGWPSPELVQGAATEYINRALMLGKDDPLVLVYVGAALSEYVGDIEAAAAYLDKALKLDPNLAAAWLWAGWAVLRLGNHKQAFEYFQRMLRLSPFDPRTVGAKVGLAFSCFLQDRYEDAASWADQTLLEHPNHPGASRMAIASRVLLFGPDEVASMVARYKSIRPDDRISEIRVRAPFRRTEDVVKLDSAYRLAGLPE